MLPPFIIDQIRRREEQERARRDVERPRLELPVDSHRPEGPERRQDEEDQPERGVIILDLV